MYNFKDIASLCKVLTNFHSAGEGEPGRRAFAAALQSEFEFTAQQAELSYSRVRIGQANDARMAGHRRIASPLLQAQW